MLASDIPDAFPIPFANAPDSGTSRVVPLAPPVEPGAASLEKGFTEINMTPVAVGGIPPFGQDFNGLFNQITAWSRWQAAGGPVTYDATLQTAIGGYPAGAYLLSVAQPGTWWLSLVDNNVTNPDTGGAGWQGIVPVSTAAILFYGCL